MTYLLALLLLPPALFVAAVFWIVAYRVVMDWLFPAPVVKDREYYAKKVFFFKGDDDAK